MSVSQTSSPSSPAVFVYSSSPVDEHKPAVFSSPASSLKGVFVPSRPTSPVYFEREPTDLSPSILTDLSSPCDNVENRTPPSVPGLPRRTTHRRQAQRSLSDAPSIAASTASSRLRIVRRYNPQAYDRESKVSLDVIQLHIQPKPDAESSSPPKSGAPNGNTERSGAWYRSKTWPSYQALRRTVTGMWPYGRKEPAITLTGTHDALEAQVRTTSSEQPHAPHTSSRPFHPFLSLRRRKTCVTEKSHSQHQSRRGAWVTAATTTTRSASPNNGMGGTRAHLRKSHSFSGFNSVLAVIADDDEGFHELTQEASRVTFGIQRDWTFEDHRVEG